MKPQTRMVQKAIGIGVLAVACSSRQGEARNLSESEGTETSEASLEAAGQRPLPCKNGEFVFDSSRVHLMYLDALSSCAAGELLGSHGLSVDLAKIYSLYWTHSTDMATRAAYQAAYEIFPNPQGNELPEDGFSWGSWFSARTAGSSLFDNCSLPDDPSSTGAVVPLQHGIDLIDYVVDYGGLKSRESFEAMDVGVRLCVAQTLRKSAPGASGSEAVLLTEHEQRHLLALIRDNAQMSMLHGAFLTSVLSSPPVSTANTTLTNLQNWAEEAGPSDRPRPAQLARIGADLATAVQLHIDVTEELLHLIARSRSARTPILPSTEGTDADEIWGSGSWQQRLLALAFGGDPFVNRDGGAWDHIAKREQTSPYEGWFTVPLAPGWTSAQLEDPNVLFRSWPSRGEHPYVLHGIREPQVWRLISLARELGVLSLALLGSGPAIDKVTTATTLFDTVEDKLRGPSCNGCTIGNDVESTLLWQRYRITREHAQVATAFLTAAVGEIIAPTQETSNFSVPRAKNLFNIVGELEVAGGKLELTHSDLVVRTLRQLAGPFTRYGDYFTLVPPQFKSEVLAARPVDLGFLSTQDSATVNFTALSPSSFNPWFNGYASEGMRRVGAVSALALTRDLLQRALLVANSNNGTAERHENLLLHTHKVIDAIDSAIGAESIVVRPEATVTSAYPYTRLTTKVDPTNPARSLRRVSITPDLAESFWNAPPSQKYWILVSADPAASTLGAQPGIPEHPNSINERTIETVASAALQSGSYAELIKNGSDEPYYEAVVPAAIELNSGMGQNTFIVMRATSDEKDDFLYCPYGGGPHWQSATFRLMAGDLPLRPGNRGDAPDNNYWTLRDTRAVAFEGTLGNFLDRQLTLQASDPSQPAYDAFDLPTNWVPPTDPELLVTSGQDATSYFLNLSRRSAEDAASAVDRAFQNLIEEQIDESNKRAATEQTALMLEQATEELCGTELGSCDVVTTTTTPKQTWYPSLSGWVPEEGCEEAWGDAVSWFESQNPTTANDEDAAGKLLLCMQSAVISSVLQQSVDVAQPVLDELESGKTSVPAFASYRGGRIQSVLIEQFRALRAPDEQIASLRAAVDSAMAHLATARAALEGASDAVRSDCGIYAGSASSAAAVMSGFIGGGALVGSVGCGPGAVVGAGVGALVGGLISLASDIEEKQRRCEQATASLAVAKKQSVAQYYDAIAAVRNTSTGTMSTLAMMAQSGAAIHLAKNEAKNTAARAQLEAALATTTGYKTSFGIVRQYRAYDMWRAKALVENARRYALAARRSIENRFVVNLSDLTKTEPFVNAPSTWANEVYEYDLSLPAAVGLQVGPADENGVYPNKVLDYVNNLESFVAGYSVERPTAAGVEDVEVITLPGISTGLDPEDEAALASRGVWFLYCSDTDAWSGLDEFEAACSKPASKARLEFSLDPWGRVNAGLTHEPLTRRHNTRWGLLAVNLVGTGVRDCSAADDSLGCYAEGFVDFDLVQRGVPWTTDESGTWRALEFPQGHIEAGKALAAEVWLDPLQDGWQTSYVAPIARSELVDRPIGGQYELTIDLAPEVRYERIERVQLLQGSKYWVSQAD